MKKILLSLVVIVAAAAIIGGATYSYFSSTKTSTDNTFAAATFDLLLTKDSTFATQDAQLFTETGMAPGVSVGPKTLYFKNASTIAGKVKLNTSYVSADVTPNDIDVTNDDFARNLRVTSGLTDSVEVSGYWAGHIIQGAYAGNATNALADMAIYEVSPGVYGPTVYGLKQVTLYFDDGTTPFKWNAGDVHNTAFTLQLNPDATNDYQSDGINVTLTATMGQWENPTF